MFGYLRNLCAFIFVNCVGPLATCYIYIHIKGCSKEKKCFSMRRCLKFISCCVYLLKIREERIFFILCLCLVLFRFPFTFLLLPQFYLPALCTRHLVACFIVENKIIGWQPLSEVFQVKKKSVCIYGATYGDSIRWNRIVE